jgi:hypothetical protein
MIYQRLISSLKSEAWIKVLPVINIVQYAISFSSSMGNNQVFFYPCYEVVFKGSFDDLMKEIRRNKFVNIGSWKIICEGLIFGEILEGVLAMISLTITSETMPCSLHKTGTSYVLISASVMSFVRRR